MRITHHNTGAQSTSNEEESKAIVDCLESLLDVKGRTFGFGSNHGDVLRPNNAERGCPKRAEESFESAKRTGGEILCKRARIIPVSEAIGIVLWVAANHCDEGKTKPVRARHCKQSAKNLCECRISRLTKPSAIAVMNMIAWKLPMVSLEKERRAQLTRRDNIQDEDEDDFAAGEPKFGLAICFDREKIE